MERHLVRMPGRQTIWTSDDLMTWCNLLRDAFPQVLFHEQFSSALSEDEPERPPEVIFHDSLVDIRMGLGEIIIADRDWRPHMLVRPGPYCLLWTWARQPPVTGANLGGHGEPMMPTSRVRRPKLNAGSVFLRYHRDDREAKSIAMKALRLVGKMSTNKLMLCDRTTLAIKGPATACMFWAGHHAIRWCLDDPRRTLDGIFLPPEAHSRWPVPDVPGDIELLDRRIMALAADEAAYTAALLDAFPGIRFVDGPLWWRDKPALRYIDGIAAATADEVSLLLPPAGWEPQFALSPAGHWLVANRPFPQGTFSRSRTVMAGNDPSPTRPKRFDHGTLHFEWPAELVPAQAIAYQAMHLLCGQIDD